MSPRRGRRGVEVNDRFRRGGPGGGGGGDEFMERETDSSMSEVQEHMPTAMSLRGEKVKISLIVSK